MSSSNQQSKRVINVDDLTPSSAPTRSRRGGRLMSLGSTPCRGSSSSHVTLPCSSRSTVSLSSPRAKAFRSSLKGREHNDLCVNLGLMRYYMQSFLLLGIVRP